MLAYAKSEEEIIKLATPTNRAEALKMISKSYCAMGLTGEIESEIVNSNTIANTADRKNKLNQFNFISGGYFAEEVSCD